MLKNRENEDHLEQRKHLGAFDGKQARKLTEVRLEDCGQAGEAGGSSKDPEKPAVRQHSVKQQLAQVVEENFTESDEQWRKRVAELLASIVDVEMKYLK